MQHGLQLSGARPPLAAYVATLWQRRHFIWGYATARSVSMYTEARLGQLWQVLTPLLNAGVYWLIFGILFQASRGVQHYPAFLLAGVFVFAFTERSIVTGSNVMRANLQLIRALYFPRASLPLAYVLVELQQMLVGFIVLIPVMLAIGEPPSWYWFLLVPAVLLQTMFNIGAALIVARLGGSLADVSELIPFFLRITRYFCGVMYMITLLPGARALVGPQGPVAQPAGGVHLAGPRGADAVRTGKTAPGNKPYSAGVVRRTSTPSPGEAGHPPLQAYCHAVVTNNDLWIAAVGWGMASSSSCGVVFFWQAETQYGRG